MIKKIFFIHLAALLFLPSICGAETESFTECQTAIMEPGQMPANACLAAGGKVEACHLKCGAKMLADNETCCCRRSVSYSCRWQGVTKAENTTMVNLAPKCIPNKEIKGTDCDPSKKPENKKVNGEDTPPICCCPGNPNTESTKKADFVMPVFQIPIDTIKLSEAKCTGDDNSGECEIPWIAEYIQGIYRYGLGIGGILAAIVLMAGGVLWLVSAGDSSKISQAKDLIVGSITGIIILLSTYIILSEINPNLTTLKSISIKMIEPKAIEADAENTEAITMSIEDTAKLLGVKCGTDSVSQIIQKAKGKITYDNANRGKSGPNNTAYNDCSGFAYFVIKCGLSKNSDSNTGNIFSQQNAWNKNISQLNPGDLVGWSPSNSKAGYGHVFIYMGDGIFGDCHGGESGRKPGNCVSTNLTLQNVLASAAKHADGKLFFRRY